MGVTYAARHPLEALRHGGEEAYSFADLVQIRSSGPEEQFRDALMRFERDQGACLIPTGTRTAWAESR
jgi:hypothetical protein